MPKKPKKNTELALVGDHGKYVQSTLFPVATLEVDGIGMGVLSDGTPYLTLRGLARICGVVHSGLHDFATNWDEEKKKPRGKKIAELLAFHGHDGGAIRMPTVLSGADAHVYVDSVCMAILEFYAFETPQKPNPTALHNYRLLARSSFREFIYKSCGYDPARYIPDSWKNFHERVLLNDQIPGDYFSVFRELAGIVIHMIQGGCPIDDHTVPDISAGIRWANYWGDKDFDAVYGLRVKHPHFYPEWFPQSGSNPQAVWIYPVDALGEFRKWLYSVYIPESFPNYLSTKVKQGVLPASHATLVLKSVENKGLIGVEPKA